MIENEIKTDTFFYGLFGIISVVMDRKMLKGIRKRAEAAVKRTATT
jgi:hypothetical protein